MPYFTNNGPTIVAPYVAQGVTLSGGFYNKLAGPIAADSKTGLVSFWIKNASASGTDRDIFFSTGPGTDALRIIVHSSGYTSITGQNATFGTLLFTRTASTTFASMASWKHVLMSWDLAVLRGQVYINGGADLAASPTLSNDVISYSIATSSTFGAIDNGTLTYSSDIADFQLWAGVNVDISVLANRSAFITPVGRPVDPSLAPGILGIGAPNVMFSGSVASWASNDGTGGAFTLQTGSIVAAATNPP